jgi:hypothetical protein
MRYCVDQVVALCDATGSSGDSSSSDSTVVATLQQSGAIRLWQLGTQQVSLCDLVHAVYTI